MASIRELAPRVLRKLTVLASGEHPEASDFELAMEKLRAVHSALRSRGLLRWTLDDVPDPNVQEAYVMMAAFLAAPEFQKPADAGLWATGMREIETAVALTGTGITPAEYF